MGGGVGARTCLEKGYGMSGSKRPPFHAPSVDPQDLLFSIFQFHKTPPPKITEFSNILFKMPNVTCYQEKEVLSCQIVNIDIAC